MKLEQKSIRTNWWLLLILLLTILVYSSSLSNGFTNWDDQDQVTRNVDIHSLSLSNTTAIFSSFYVGMYQPFTTQLYGFIYGVFGESAMAFHLVSLLLHLLNILLVFRLVHLFSRREIPALITAALFALNPLQTESVAWVSAMSNLLYTTFFLAGLISYLHYFRKHNIRFIWMTLLFFICSLLSKPAAVTFPVILVLIDLHYRRRYTWRVITEKLPFFILSIAIGLLIIYAREEAGHIIDISERFSAGERIIMIVYALAFYVARLFIPVGLSAFHPYPTDGLPIEFFIAPIIPLMLIFLVFRLRGEQKRQVRAGFLFFIIAIAVVLEFIPVGAQVVKERYVYLPSIGIYYAFAVLLLYLTDGKHSRKWISAGIMTLMLIAFSYTSFVRAGIWQNSMSLWNDVIAHYPYASAALINRGNTWQESEKFRDAISDYTLAIQYEPQAADAYFNRGLAHYRLQETAKALEDFNTAISLGLADTETYNKRGLLRAASNDIQGAISDFEMAVSIDPSNVDALINQGLMYARNRDFNLAITSFSNALSITPSSAKAYYWRGMVQLQMGQRTEACRDFTSAISHGWPMDQIPEVCR